MMHLSLVLWAISSYTYAISIPPFIYTSTPLSYDDAELYCQSKYGTDLATIKNMPDRWAAINVISGDGDAGRIWTGLRNTREIGWFNFFEADVECPMPFTGACVKFWRKDGKPRCHMRQKNGDGFECTVFYLDENLIDNDVNCTAKLPFLCNQQYDYTFGSELPAPGDVYQIKDGHGSGYIKLSENVKYLHQSHTLQCVIEYDEDDNVLHESFVEITKEMYGSTDIGIDSILLATGPIFNLLPPSCTRVPAVKVIDLIELSNSVKLYIKEAALFEYIPEMDIDGTNYEVFGNGEEAPITIPNPEEEFANNNITNGSFNIYTLTCAVYDVDGFQIGTEDPVDGKCNGKTVFDEYGGTFGDGFNTNTDDRRRLWGWFKKAINWVEKKIVKPVTKVFRVIVSLITGNIDERVFDSGLYIDEKVQYKISGNQNLYAPKDEKGNDKKLSVSVMGTFKMQAGVKFIFNVYADFKAKYKIWTLKPSFDYFKFVLGANNEFDAYVNMEIQGGVRINYKLLKTSAREVFMLGPVPVVIKLHGDLSVGIDIKLDLVISQSVGYEPLFVRYGVEYIKGSGWKKISDSNLQFIPRKKFGGEVEDSLSCPKFTVEPFVALNVGVTFYEIVDVWLRTTASLPTSISWPDTCDTTPSCNHDPHQLKFGISFSINMDIGLAVKVPLIGLTIAAKSWHIWDKSWPLADVCTNLEIASLLDVCCATGTSSTTTTPAPTELEAVSISCVTRAGSPVIGIGSISRVTCPSGETMVSCGVDGTQEIGGTKMDNNGVCTALSNHATWSVKAMGRCCVFPSNAITSISVVRSSSGERVSSQCNSNIINSNSILTGCSAYYSSGGFNKIQGSFAGPITTEPQTSSWISSENNCNAESYSGGTVTSSATCLNVDNEYILSCKTKAKKTDHANFGQCETGYSMMACNTFTDSYSLDSYYINSNDACYIIQDGHNQMFGNAICCKLEKIINAPAPTCDMIYDFDILGSTSLTNNGGCPDPSDPCHQVKGRVYKKSSQCYKALTGCSGCLSSAASYPQHLQPIPCNPCNCETDQCDCDIIYDYDKLGTKSLVDNGGCPNGPCHQVKGRVYKKSGQCYKALTGCYGCLPSAASYPEALQPIPCNPCDDGTVAANSYIGDKLLLNPIISNDSDNKFYSNDNKWYLWIGTVLVLVNICACLFMYCACVKPRINKYKLGYNAVHVTDKEMEAIDL